VKFTSNKKEEVLFYTDRPYNLRVNPGKMKLRQKTTLLYLNALEFIESWRKISVEGLDDKKIWEFLDNHGHYGLTKHAPRQGV
jgi:hypothetical protein